MSEPEVERYYYQDGAMVLAVRRAQKALAQVRIGDFTETSEHLIAIITALEVVLGPKTPTFQQEKP